MSTESPTAQILLAENAELRARLEEAEETLSAIHSGKVDALVLEGHTGPQLFVLQGLDAELNRFRGEILEQVNDAVIVIDDDRITYLNRAAGQQYGVSVAKMLGHSIKEMYQSRWIQPEDEVYATSALAETGRWVGENIHIKRNGEVINVEISLSRLHPNRGVLAVIRDITERKRNEKRLIESERRFADIIELAMDAIITINADHQILLFNTAAEKIFGCKADDVIGCSIERFIPAWFRPSRGNRSSAFGRKFTSGRRMRMRSCVTGLRVNGKEFPVELSISQAEVAGEKTVIAILRDISERRRAEDRLQESQRENTFLAYLLRASEQPMAVGYPDGRIGLVNTAFEALTGYSTEELKHINWATELTPPEWLEVERKKISELMYTGQSIRYEKEYIRKNGTRVPIELLVHLKLDVKGKPEFYYAFVTDITERKKAEERLSRLSRTLQAFSKSGRALIYATDEASYLQKICRIIVEDCGHDMAWVGLAENDATKTVRPVASAGFEEGYLETLHISWADCERGRGPTGTAIRNGQTCLCTDMLTDPHFAPWRAEAIKRGFASSAAFPLLIDGRAIGSLTLYSQEPASFEGEEVQLLTELADDLAFGITTLRLRVAHTKTTLALRENEQRMRLATGATGVGIWEWNLFTNQIHWDTQMFRIYGVAPTTDGFVHYATWVETIFSEDLPRQEQEMQKTIHLQEDNHREFRIRRADDGQCRHIQAVETVRTNAHGQVEWLVGTNLDITERIHAQAAILESEERWRFALDVTQIGAWELNLEDHSAWRSLRHDQIFGYESLLQTWTFEMFIEHVLEEDRPLVESSFQCALATDQDWSFECRIRRADGPVRWIWACGKKLNVASGPSPRMFGVVADITERKQAEQALRDSARRKDEFLAMLAHELRNPLAPIRNAVEIQKHANTDPSRITWCTDMIDRQVTHLTGLVDDLLDVSRISRGLIQLKKESLEIRDFIQPAIDTSLPLIDARKQKLAITLPPERLWVEGDRIRLTQVVSNLINNAAKYTEEGGQLGLSVEASGGAVCIRVSDNGCGIDPADLNHLFDLFYQAARNLDRSQGGLGIGLSIVSNLVEMHGGNVQAFSAGLNHGSEFVVRLPQLMSDESSTSFTTAPGVSAPKCRILIVDDYHDVAKSLGMLLEIDGHQVYIANEGPAALEIARAERPDVILLDIGLPEMSGYEVAQELRRNSELARTLLIAMTGYGRLEDREMSLAAGFDEHLVKPIDYKKLRELLINYHANKDKP